MDARLVGKRVLVVEDEVLIAMMLEGVLEDAGCTVVGPFARVGDALQAASSEAVDLALLDVNVAGEKVFPVALALEGRRIPFLFLTGYGNAALPKDRPDWQTCPKPFRTEQLTEQLGQIVAKA